MRTIREVLKPFLFLALSMGLITAGCAGDRSPTRTDKSKETLVRGELAGKATIGRRYGPPVIPGETPEPPNPAIGLELLISTLSGQKVDSAVTGSGGIYNILLPPGIYHVEMTPSPLVPADMGYSDQLPAIVVITEGQETRLDVHISGR